MLFNVGFIDKTSSQTVNEFGPDLQKFLKK